MYKTRKQDKIQESIQSKKNEVQRGASKKMRGRALIQNRHTATRRRPTGDLSYPTTPEAQPPVRR